MCSVFLPFQEDPQKESHGHTAAIDHRAIALESFRPGVEGGAERATRTGVFAHDDHQPSRGLTLVPAAGDENGNGGGGSRERDGSGADDWDIGDGEDVKGGLHPRSTQETLKPTDEVRSNLA